jgi:hypothetical protein
MSDQEKPTQRTEKGLEVPVPDRADVERDLAELVKDAKPLPAARRTGTGGDETRKT